MSISSLQVLCHLFWDSSTGMAALMEVTEPVSI